MVSPAREKMVYIRAVAPCAVLYDVGVARFRMQGVSVSTSVFTPHVVCVWECVYTTLHSRGCIGRVVVIVRGIAFTSGAPDLSAALLPYHETRRARAASNVLVAGTATATDDAYADIAATNVVVILVSSSLIFFLLVLGFRVQSSGIKLSLECRVQSLGCRV